MLSKALINGGGLGYLPHLKKLSIVWRGDIYAPAVFVFCSYDDNDREVNAMNRCRLPKTRPALLGLIADYAMLTKVPRSQVEKDIKAFGFSLGS